MTEPSAQGSIGNQTGPSQLRAWAGFMDAGAVLVGETRVLTSVFRSDRVEVLVLGV